MSETDGGGVPSYPEAGATIAATSISSGVTSGAASTPLVCATPLLSTTEGAPTSIHPALLNQPSLLLEQTLEDVEEVKEEVILLLVVYCYYYGLLDSLNDMTNVTQFSFGT